MKGFAQWWVDGLMSFLPPGKKQGIMGENTTN